MKTPLTRNGVHGTLYRYTVTYQDKSRESPVFNWPCWAYSIEHALDKFAHDSEGWQVLGVKRHTVDT